MPGHPEMPVLDVLDSALLAAMRGLSEAHDLTATDEETPYYHLPQTSAGWIATCLVATASALREILVAYRQATAHPDARRPSGPN